MHCVQTPASATSIASFGPMSISAIRSAAYETESVQVLLSGNGRRTFHVDVRQDSAVSAAKASGSAMRVGTNHAVTRIPPAMIAATYVRAGAGSAQ